VQKASPDVLLLQTAAAAADFAQILGRGLLNNLMQDGTHDADNCLLKPSDMSWFEEFHGRITTMPLPAKGRCLNFSISPRSCLMFVFFQEVHWHQQQSLTYVLYSSVSLYPPVDCTCIDFSAQVCTLSSLKSYAVLLLSRQQSLWTLLIETTC
jgi:hypothetical protein